MAQMPNPVSRIKRLLPRQRAAMAIVVALTVGTIGVALADPQSGGVQPGVTLDLNPHPPYAVAQTVTVTGAGFQSGGVGFSGTVYQAATLPDGSTAFGVTEVPFTSNSQGVFTSTLQVSPTFQAFGAGGAPILVDCNAPGVTCFVEATSNSGAFSARHTITFGSGMTTTTSTTLPPTTTSSSTSTTLPPTTTSSSTSTTLPPTTTTSSTSTTLPPTTTTSSTSTTLAPTTTTTTTTTVPPTPPPANPLCSALLQLRASVDALGSSFPAFRPFAAQFLALLDQVIALFGCGGQSAGTAAAPPPAGLPTGNGLNIGDLLGVTGSGPLTARSEPVVPGEYVVVPGDTLSALSETMLGDGDLYPTLLEMNQDQIDDADLLIPGQVIRVPVGETG